MAPKQQFKVLLVGNPNCGKTTIFNSLSGMKAKVGNYSGVTVDKKTGRFEVDGAVVEVEDLESTRFRHLARKKRLPGT